MNGKYEIRFEGAPCGDQVFVLKEILSTERMWPTGARALIVRIEPPWRKEWETTTFADPVDSTAMDILGLAENSIDATFDQWMAKDHEEYFPVQMALFCIPFHELPHFIETGNLAELYTGTIRAIETIDEPSTPLQKIW